MNRLSVAVLALTLAIAGSLTLAQHKPGEPCPKGTTEVRPGTCRAPELPPPSILDYRPRSTLVADEHSPNGRALRVTWTPGAGHAARVTGACDPEFKEKVERMYLSVRHGAEFALPDAGTAPRRERLENYAWTVEVE